MEKNKKVKFNGMDLFIVIVLVVVIAAGAFLLISKDEGVVSQEETKKLELTFELAAKDEGYEDLIKVGDTVMIGVKDKMTTTIEKIEVNPAKTVGYDITEGKVIESEFPAKNDIKITLSAEGVETNKDIKIDDVVIKVGQHLALFSKNWSSTGYVIGLEVVGE